MRLGEICKTKQSPATFNPLQIFTLFLVVGLLTACTSARINQFKQFSQASVVYSNATDLLTREAGEAAIDADSAILKKVRPSLNPSDLKVSIVTQNELLKERLELLADLRRHAFILRNYFTALGVLAESDAPSGIGKATEGIVTSLGEVNSRINTATIGDQSVSDFVGDAVPIVVAQFQRAALEKELKSRAETLERELDLQQAAMEALSKSMKTDLKIVLGHQESEEIVRPYVSSANPLPNNWTKRRRELLTSTCNLASVEAAADAAKNLKLSFVPW